MLTIRGEHVRAVNPEGLEASLPLADFLQLANPATGYALILPDGVKASVSERWGRALVWVGEYPPHVRAFKVISEDSPVPYGEGARYKQRRFAIPYTVILCPFVLGSLPNGENALMVERRRVEHFWRTRPLSSFDDEVFFPCILNTSKFLSGERDERWKTKGLSWPCTTYIGKDGANATNEQTRLTAGYRNVLDVIFNSELNWSSENHQSHGEDCSFFSFYKRTGRIDPRMASFTAWERASADDPLFPLKLNLISADHTVRQVLHRMFNLSLDLRSIPLNAASLANIVFNHGQIRFKEEELL